MNAPTTEPSTRTPTSRSDQIGTVLFTPDGVDSIWFIMESFRRQRERKGVFVTVALGK